MQDCNVMKHRNGTRWRVLCLHKRVVTVWKNDERCGILSYMRINRKRGYLICQFQNMIYQNMNSQKMIE